MNCRWISVAAVITFIAIPALALAQEDVEGAKDTPYLSRMPGFHIAEHANKEFDSYQLCDGTRLFNVEGRVYQNNYQQKEDAPKVSLLQVRRNYVNAIKGLGGQIVLDGMCEKFDDPRSGTPIVTGKIVKPGKEVWVEVYAWDNGGVQYQLTVIEKEAMKQEVTASDLLKALNADGHVALYINFDTAKADIRPDSAPILDEVASMLSGNPALNLSVEGHTDNSGTPAGNKTLSQSRAKAVVAALVQRGVAAARLSAVGLGQDKPVADNGTEDGRAKNRRVELVKK